MTSTFSPQTIDLSASAVQLIQTALKNPRVTFDKTGLKSYDSLGNIVAELLANGQGIVTILNALGIKITAASTALEPGQNANTIAWSDPSSPNAFPASLGAEYDNTLGAIWLTLLQKFDQISKTYIPAQIALRLQNPDDAYLAQIILDSSRGIYVRTNLVGGGFQKTLLDMSGGSDYTQESNLTGIIVPFGGATPPTNWLSCDGSAISRTTYAALFAVIGTAYGAGDGSTTFNLPDLRGRSIVGAGQGTGLTNRNLGDTGGSETVTLTSAQIPAHSHPNTLTDPGHTHPTLTAGGTFMQSATSGGSSLATGTQFSQSAAATTGSRTTGIGINNANNTGGGGSHPNMLPFGVAKWIIHI